MSVIGGVNMGNLTNFLFSFTDGSRAANWGATFPSIKIEKDVSPDEGITWHTADTAPGPDVLSDIVPYFRFRVTNTGNVALNNIQIIDNIYGLIGTSEILLPSNSLDFVIAGIWALGAQINTATVLANVGGQTFSDTNSANWVGVEIDKPAMEILKEVSTDNGLTWFNANTPTGPLILTGTNPQFRFTVTNTGNVPLTNVEINDNVYGLILGPENLAVTDSLSEIITESWALGQQSNLATATGDYGGQTVSAQDPAYWFGVEEETAAIQLFMEVSPDNGFSWYGAEISPGPDVPEAINPQFHFRVRNIGNVPLTNVEINDDVYGLILGPINLAIGEVESEIITRPWIMGQQVNTAIATCDEEVSDEDSIYWFGLEAAEPEIDILKEISLDNGLTWLEADTPPGPDIPYLISPLFRYTVANSGPVGLIDIEVTDDVYGVIGTAATLEVGFSISWVIVGNWAYGQETNIATAEGFYNDVRASATDSANYMGVIPAIAIKKFVSIDEGLTWLEADSPPGPLLPEGVTAQFKFTVTNTGDVTLINITVTDNVLGFIGLLTTLDPSDSYDFFA